MVDPRAVVVKVLDGLINRVSERMKHKSPPVEEGDEVIVDPGAVLAIIQETRVDLMALE